MSETPKVLVFDVNETLSDMTPLSRRFTDVGADPALARVWFASLLRDGFALTVVGSPAGFAVLGSSVLSDLLAQEPGVDDTDGAVDHIMSGFLALALHPDVEPGIRSLRKIGLRLVTLSNGSRAVADRLLASAGVSHEFEQLLSVEDAGIWKPAAQAYEFAARSCQVGLQEMMLVAVHPWDIDGAARAGMLTCWINRSGRSYPSYFTSPDVTVVGLDDLPHELAG